MNQLNRQRLLRDHRHFDDEIQHAMRQGWVDPIALRQLKKQKLAIKDLLHQISQPTQQRLEALAAVTPAANFLSIPMAKNSCITL